MLKESSRPLENTDSPETWVYSLSAPIENGEAPTTFILARPKITKEGQYLLPDDMAQDDCIYELDVRMNIIIGDKTIECVAKCTLSTQLGGNEFLRNRILVKSDLSATESAFIKSLYERPLKGTPLYDRLLQETEKLCREVCAGAQLGTVRGHIAGSAAGAMA
jgi:hypothetical protein